MKLVATKSVAVDLLPTSRPLTDRAMRLSQQIRNYDAELANLLMRLEQESRKGTGRRRKVQLDGVKGKSGGFYLDGKLLDGGEEGDEGHR